jgi:hypothetical protein
MVDAPAIRLGQKWQRTQVGQKNSCSQWGDAAHTQGAEVFFSFGGGWGFGSLLFPLSSHQVFTEFSSVSQDHHT